MTVAEWLAYAKADAEKRGLKDLIPALEGLAKATEQLRRADWNEAADSRRLDAELPVGSKHDHDDL